MYSGARTVFGRWEVFSFQQVLTSEDTESAKVGGVEFSMLTKQVIQITSEFFAHEIIRSMKMYEFFKFK